MNDKTLFTLTVKKSGVVALACMAIGVVIGRLTKSR